MLQRLRLSLYYIATHYHFLREIPMFHKYEVRQRIVGWDNKWVGFFLPRMIFVPYQYPFR